MKIGLFTSECSFYNGNYPNSREIFPLLSFLKEQGHEIFCVYPQASPRVIEYYNDPLKREKLYDIVDYVTLVPEGETIDDLDVLFVNELPFSQSNWFKRDLRQKLLHYYANIAKKVLWKSEDEEFALDKKFKTFLRDYLPNKGQDILKKIDAIFYFTLHNITNDDIKKKVVYFPELYAKSRELDIIPLSKKNQGFVFSGNWTYRVELGKIIKEYLLPYLKEKNIKSSIFDDKLKKNFTSYYEFEGNYDLNKEWSEYADILEFYDKRILAKEEAYYKAIAKGIFSVHSSVKEHPGYRLIECGYAGSYILSTWYEYFDLGSKKFLRQDFDYTKLKDVLNMTDEEYIQVIQEQRKMLDYQFNEAHYNNLFLEYLNR